MGPFNRGSIRFSLLFLTAAIILIAVINYLITPQPDVIDVDFSTFKAKVQNSEINRVEMTPSHFLFSSIEFPFYHGA